MSLQSELTQFIGTERWFRHPFKQVTYTEGVRYFAEEARAYWLLDILATELLKLVREHSLVFVKATAKDNKTDLVAVRDEGESPLWHRHIDHTDLPEGEWNLWMGEGGPGDTVVILLPSEY